MKNLTLDPWMVIYHLFPFCDKIVLGNLALCDKFYYKSSRKIIHKYINQEKRETLKYWKNAKKIIKLNSKLNFARIKTINRTSQIARLKIRLKLLNK